MKMDNLPLWHVVVSIPGLNIDKYILSETEPTLEQIQAVWDADGGSATKVKPRGWSGSLSEAYPGVGLVERLAVVDLTVPAEVAGDKVDLLEGILAEALLNTEGWTDDAIRQARSDNDEDWKSAVRRAFAVAAIASQSTRAETPAGAEYPEGEFDDAPHRAYRRWQDDVKPGYWCESGFRAGYAAGQAALSPTPAAPLPTLRYTPEVGDAADAYLRSVALYGRYDLPARCRFHELFDAMVRAAQQTRAGSI